MTTDELKRLRILYDKMKETAHQSRSGMIDVILMPWIKELHGILEPYAKDNPSASIRAEKGNEDPARQKSWCGS